MIYISYILHIYIIHIYLYIYIYLCIYIYKRKLENLFKVYQKIGKTKKYTFIKSNISLLLT